MDLTNLTTRIEQVYPAAVEFRRHLHQFPELSEKEKNTADYICKVLEEHDISYQSEVAGFGIIGSVGAGAPCIAIRADIDALPIEEDTGLSFASSCPGVMHACGHDMHTAILLGAAIVLKEMEADLPGTVKFLFQPAEETVGGAENMVKAGALSNPPVSSIIALHMDPSIPTGAITYKEGAFNASVTDFVIDIEGVQCHGAHPETGVDSIVTAAALVMNLQTIASRATAPTDPIIVTVGEIKAGNSSNIIPQSARLHGTLRTLSEELRIKSIQMIEQMTAGTCQAFRASASITWGSNPYPPLINDKKVTEAVKEAASEMLSKEQIKELPAASMGGDDFAFFTREIPGTYFNLGCAKAGVPAAPLHSQKFDPDEEAIPIGIELEIRSVLKLLEAAN